MVLGDLIAGLGVTGAAKAGGTRICDLTDDSRTVVPGTLFIARRGTRADGRQFVGDAVRAGAAAVLTDDPGVCLPGGCGAPVLIAPQDPGLAVTAAIIAERFHGRPTDRLTLIGITGTNGKTTTAHLVHQVLNACGVRCGLVGTVLVDDGREVAPATLTTPPAAELSRTFATMVECGCRAAVMEVSSHALYQGRVAGLRFDTGVFTNLTGDHMDYHGTMAAYARAKAALFAMLPPGGTAVVNAEDPYADLMTHGCRAGVLRCVIRDSVPDRDAECVATIRSTTLVGSEATLAGPWGRFDVSLGLVGRYNVMNALEAAAACHAAGIEADRLRDSLSRAVAPPGRLEPVTGPDDGFTVLVDYAHTDDALRQVLTAVRPMLPAGSSLRLVFGCGGDRDRTKRPRMGAAAAELADVVYVTSDNPRTEDPRSIIDQVLGGIDGGNRHKLRVEVDRAAAVRLAVSEAREGDLVLIVGKGHEAEQILPDGRGGTRRTRFDDREAGREAVAERRGSSSPVVVRPPIGQVVRGREST
jgi:UDP-N-acetylmuramoyl-L-alanyl-D-glutamate--2,6-diaminopimelate ligase